MQPICQYTTTQRLFRHRHTTLKMQVGMNLNLIRTFTLYSTFFIFTFI